MVKNEFQLNRDLIYKIKEMNVKKIHSNDLDLMIQKFLSEGGSIKKIPPAENMYYNPIFPDHEMHLNLRTVIYGESQKGIGPQYEKGIN